MNGNKKKVVALGSVSIVLTFIVLVFTTWGKAVDAITPAVADAVEEKISGRLEDQDKDISRNEAAMLALARKHDSDMARMMDKFDIGMREIRTSLATMDREQQELLMQVLSKMGGTR